MAKELPPRKLFVDERCEIPWMERTARGVVAAWSDVSPARPGTNEDAALVVSVGEVLLLAVADGLGGGPDGEIAARVALEQLLAAVELAEPKRNSLRCAVLDGIDAANEAVQRLGSGAATTLSVVEIGAGTMRAYHVGDSAILLLSARGRIKYQTVSHSPVGYGIESGMLDREAAMHHEQRHLVLNVVGSPEMHIEVGPLLPLVARDRVLVASDGLTDNLTADEMAAVAVRGGPAGAVGELAARARRRMSESVPGVPSKPDDLTLLLLRAR